MLSDGALPWPHPRGSVQLCLCPCSVSVPWAELILRSPSPAGGELPPPCCPPAQQAGCSGEGTRELLCRAGSAHLPAERGRNRSCGTGRVLRCVAVCIAWPVPELLLCIVQLSVSEPHIKRSFQDLFLFFFFFQIFVLKNRFCGLNMPQQWTDAT